MHVALSRRAVAASSSSSSSSLRRLALSSSSGSSSGIAGNSSQRRSMLLLSSSAAARSSILRASGGASALLLLPAFAARTTALPAARTRAAVAFATLEPQQQQQATAPPPAPSAAERASKRDRTPPSPLLPGERQEDAFDAAATRAPSPLERLGGASDPSRPASPAAAPPPSGPFSAGFPSSSAAGAAPSPPSGSAAPPSVAAAGARRRSAAAAAPTATAASATSAAASTRPADSKGVQQRETAAAASSAATAAAHGRLPAAPSSSSEQAAGAAAAAAAVVQPKEPLLVKTRRIMRDMPRIIREGAAHYWLGTKLLYFEIKTTISIVNRLLHGHTMTRRERRQLIRTTSDLLRLIPFSVFVIVPFMEFLLPVALKLFPNMLPSTFEDKLKAEENMKKRLKLRIELAKFLQDTAEQLALRKDSHLHEIMLRIREGRPISNEEILKFATAFKDEYTLDNVSRAHLVAMCKYMGLPPYGSDGLLKFQLERKLRQLKLDDQMIRDEGVHTLSMEELQQALRARGMRGTSTSKAVLRKRLNEWLTLSLDHGIPEALLILTRSFVINEKDDLEGALKTTLSLLPDEVFEEISVNLDTSTAPSDLKLEVLHDQNEHISRELRELRAKKSQQGGSLSDGELAKEIELTERLKGVAQAISMLSHGAVAEERSDLAELKKERSEHRAELSAAAAARAAAAAAAAEPAAIGTPPAGGPASTAATAAAAAAGGKQKKPAPPLEDATSSGLEARLDALVSELETELLMVDRAIGTKIKDLGLLLDADRDGVISTDELAGAVKALKDKLSTEEIARIDRDKDGKISLQELLAYYQSARESDKTPTKSSV